MRAADDRSRVDRLAIARDRLAAAIDDCESMRDLPSLIREYRAVMEELEKLTPTAKAGDPVDEIAKRRSARGAGAAPRQRRTASNKG